MKSLFPDQSWTDFALSELQANRLDQFSPADAPDFLLDGTGESWVRLLAAMARHESNFVPNLEHPERGSLEGIVSTGLLQISEESARAYAKFARTKAIRDEVKKATTEKLKDPYFNLRVACIILQRWVQADGVVASSTHPWLGGARYWAVLRKGASKVKKSLTDEASSLLLASSTPSTNKAATTAAVATEVAPPAFPPEVAIAGRARNALGSACNWIFEVDFSINSKSPRLFVYGISQRKLFRYKCAHGIGGANRTPHDGRLREVSNVAGSHCSSLGVMRTGSPYSSDLVGEALRLHGLSPTNSRILARGVVLHGGQYVSDNEGGTDTSICGRSHGCFVVDDRYIDYHTGGELIEWLRDGSIGVAHYAGAFALPG